MEQYVKVKKTFTLVIIIDKRFPFFQGDNSKDEVVVIREWVKY